MLTEAVEPLGTFFQKQTLFNLTICLIWREDTHLSHLTTHKPRVLFLRKGGKGRRRRDCPLNTNAVLGSNCEQKARQKQQVSSRTPPCPPQLAECPLATVSCRQERSCLSLQTCLHPKERNALNPDRLFNSKVNHPAKQMGRM